MGAYATTFLLSFSYLLLASKMLIIITLLKVNLDGNSRVPPKKKNLFFMSLEKKWDKCQNLSCRSLVFSYKGYYANLILTALSYLSHYRHSRFEAIFKRKCNLLKAISYLYDLTNLDFATYLMKTFLQVWPTWNDI